MAATMECWGGAARQAGRQAGRAPPRSRVANMFGGQPPQGIQAGRQPTQAPPPGRNNLGLHSQAMTARLLEIEALTG